MRRDQLDADLRGAPAQHGFQPHRQGAQHDVAVEVPIGIVDLLEMVDVDGDDADRQDRLDHVDAGTRHVGGKNTGNPDQMFQPFVQHAVELFPVHQAGEVVVAGLVAVHRLADAVEDPSANPVQGLLFLSEGEAELDHRIHVGHRKERPAGAATAPHLPQQAGAVEVAEQGPLAYRAALLVEPGTADMAIGRQPGSCCG